jgi:hypothetical protein
MSTAHRGRRAAVAIAATLLALGGCATSPDSANHAAESVPPSSGRAATAPSARPVAVVYRTPSCGCCKSYEDYLRKHGFPVESKVLDDLSSIRADQGVPSDATSCHTVVVDGYAVEGHVPVEAIDLMLKDRPKVDGIGIPGMPTNAPGMGEPDGTPLEVVSFENGQVEAFTTL